ncbi:MAG TPA: hypothetical protein PK147_07200 [Saprospiraceae bacterium]|nr:hypothetical protein [Saprospiraceae bacterium]
MTINHINRLSILINLNPNNDLTSHLKLSGVLLSGVLLSHVLLSGVLLSGVEAGVEAPNVNSNAKYSNTPKCSLY